MWSRVRILCLTVCVLQSSCSPQTRASAEAGQCGNGWQRHGSSCYGIGDSPDTWSGALAICGKYGATLAEVESSAENEFLKGIARERGYRGLWLAGTDVFNEGHFEWAGSKNPIHSGTGFTDWATRQPTNMDGNEDCLHLWRDVRYQWNDAPCTEHLNFACEIRCNMETSRP